MTLHDSCLLDPLVKVPSPAYYQPPAESSVAPWQTLGNNHVVSVTPASMPQPNTQQYPVPPGLYLNASYNGSLPTAGTEQPVARQFCVKNANDLVGNNEILELLRKCGQIVYLITTRMAEKGTIVYGYVHCKERGVCFNMARGTRVMTIMTIVRLRLVMAR